MKAISSKRVFASCLGNPKSQIENPKLFDDFIRPLQHTDWNCQADLFCRLKVKDVFKRRCLLHRQTIPTMGYLTKVQVIERANQTRQYYLICPAPVAQALELEKGEEIDWVVEDRNNLVLRRVRKTASKLGRGKHGK